MFGSDGQKDINVNGTNNKIVNGDDSSVNNYFNGQSGKLGSLFLKLKSAFNNENSSEDLFMISENLKKYTDIRDTLGLEEKLRLANKEHLYDDFAWCKQEFNKKLIYYQNYEPAQEIFAFILAIVLERYRNLIKPMIREGSSEREILKTISDSIVNPIVFLIQQEGCDDIMGLTSTEIEGMFHYLTGNCHINWAI
ncbi:ABC-three component system protein [Flavobacterium sp. CLA17]|uniref:ABC-three component system protein n=1 Tax=Flavobacterium sp. CLA17 TaxID=2724135 RepID=UPI001493177C|nr:ABC-three component system protein [Flavobacterium sp. CLA17]QSB28512.1 hypothetical protein HAV12_007190 [Flavobacterium sp. CLA17]